MSNNKKEDVMAFLNDLDSLTLTASTKKPSNKQDVSTFLDEFTNNKTTVKKDTKPIPAVATEKSKATASDPVASSIPRAAAAKSEIINEGKKAEPTKESSNYWSNVGQMWSTAATSLSSITQNTINQAQNRVTQIADETAKVVNSEKVQGFITQSRGELSKLISTATPPPSNSLTAETITIWMCIENTGEREDLDSLHDLIQNIVNESYVHAICRKVIVHSVKDPSPTDMESYALSKQNITFIQERLMKLAASVDGQQGGEDGMDVFLVAQGFVKDGFLQYLVCMQGGGIVVSSISQGVECAKEEDGENMAAFRKQIVSRALEMSLNDVCDEFYIRCLKQ